MPLLQSMNKTIDWKLNLWRVKYKIIWCPWKANIQFTSYLSKDLIYKFNALKPPHFILRQAAVGLPGNCISEKASNQLACKENNESSRFQNPSNMDLTSIAPYRILVLQLFCTYFFSASWESCIFCCITDSWWRFKSCLATEGRADQEHCMFSAYYNPPSRKTRHNQLSFILSMKFIHGLCQNYQKWRAEWGWACK